MFFDLDGPETQNYFNWCHLIAHEAYAAKDYLLNSDPGISSQGWIVNSTKDHRFQYIVRKHPTTNKYLVMFCLSTNDSNENSVRVKFLNHDIVPGSIDMLIPGYGWNFTLEGTDTLKVGAGDVWGRAFTLELVSK